LDGALLVVHIAFQPRRSGHEEALLAEVSPGYAAYRAKTSRVIPWNLLNDGFDMMGPIPKAENHGGTSA
jgi:hypothetical protein